jgi:peptidoglycan/xylan/chitin deacetylase (PgdA/CDA1 family)
LSGTRGPSSAGRWAAATRAAAAVAAVLFGVAASPAGRAAEGLAEGDEPVRICRWYGGKLAAISIRFDDSHQTHIDIAIPMLDERGLTGTFLVNPGDRGFQQNEEAWRAAVQQGHELGDHSLDHNGAKTDEEAERQIGEAARIIRGIQLEPRLLVFQRGGATQWLQRKPFEFFEAKYGLHNLDAPGSWNRSHRSMSCCEEYDRFSIPAFAEQLDRAIADGAWAQPYFHSIGPGTLPVSPESFDAILDIVQSRAADLWCAGMSRIHQYERERDSAAAFARALNDDTLEIWLGCGTAPGLYSQPLTLEVDLPAGPPSASVVGPDGSAVGCETATRGGRRVVRFDAAPREARYELHAAGIGTAYRKAKPQPTAPGPHPYLFFTRDQAPELLEKASDPTATVMWDAVTRAADRLRERDPKALLEENVRSRVSRPRPLLFYYGLTRDPAYAPAVASCVEAMVNDDEWHSTKSEMLITAAATCTLGLAYDWAQDAMSDDLKARVRRTIAEHGIEPVLRATAEGEWWTHWPRGNWGEVIYSQVGIGALSLLSAEPDAPDWVHLSQRKVWTYLQAIGRDGGWGESGSYALYAWTNGIMFMDALRRVTGEDLFESPRLREFPRWFINLLEPDGSVFVPFSNCGPWTEGLPSVLYRLASEYGDGYAQGAGLWQTQEHRWHADIFGFLWYDPSIAPQPLTDWPRAKLFRDIDWAMLRSAWDDPSGVLLGLKESQKD